MYIYSSKESFINKGNPNSLSINDFIKGNKDKIKELSNFQQSINKAKILQDQYNKALGELKNPNSSMGKIKNLLIEEINAQIQKYGAKVTPGNILQAISSEKKGGELAEFASQARQISLLSSTSGKAQLRGLNKKIQIIENDLAEMQKNPSAPQQTIAKIKQRLGSIKYQITKAERVFLFGKKFVDIGEDNVKEINDIISTFHSAQDALALANGDIGEILAKALIQLISQQSDQIASETVKEIIEDAVVTAAEYGAGYNIKIGFDSEGNAVSGEQLLKLVDLPNSSITINSHRGKIDTMIKYNFGDGLEKLNLSVKNYSSFSGLTLVDGTPLDTIIKYIENSEKKGILINSLINYKNSHTEENNIQTKFLNIRNSAKKALKARILQDALQGYGETILNNESMGYADIFVVFNNTEQKVQCISIPYVVAKFLQQEKTSNIKIQLNKTNIEDFSGTEKVLLSHKDEQSERLDKIYSAMNKEKIHVSISYLENYMAQEIKKKT